MNTNIQEDAPTGQMSDIVERLRRTGASGWTDAIFIGSDLELEAADEIERLRAALRDISDMASSWPDGGLLVECGWIADAALNNTEPPK